MPIVTTPSLTQTHRILQATTPLGTNALLLTKLAGNDYLSKPFEFELTFLSQLDDIPLENLMGKPVAFKVKGTSSADQVLQFHGLMTDLKREPSDIKGYCHYQAKLSPWFYMLEYTTDCRIFQNLSVPQIFTQVCKQFGYHDYDISGLTATYQPLAYCTQYNESYFNFLSRLLEEAGIFYYFTFTDNKHTMVLVDRVVDLPLNNTKTVYSNTAPSKPHFHSWIAGQRLTATKVTLGDYHYPTPNTKLQNSAQSALADTNIEGVDTFERFRYPGHFDTPSKGQTLAQRLLSNEIACAHEGEAKGNYALQAGQRFNLTQHIDSNRQGQFAIIRVHHSAHDYSHLNDKDQPKDQLVQCYQNEIYFIPMTVGFTPGLTIPRPEIAGSQSAIVIGVEKNTPHTDQYARIKVQFPWNRDVGNADDPACACWIRVAKQSAGKGFGTQLMPRPGTEVRVRYHQGNPDRPVISGMTYNANNPPPFDLPAQQGTTGFKTRTVGDSPRNAQNEFSFTDDQNKEKIKLHAHKDLKVSSKGDTNIHVKGNATHKIGGDQTITSHDSIHINMPEGLDLKASNAHIKMTPNRVVMEGLQVSLGQTGTALPLASKVPVYVPPKGTAQGTQSSETKDNQKQTQTKQKIEFLIDLKKSSGFQASVNSKNTKTLPLGQVYDYWLTEEQHAGPVNLAYQAVNHELIHDIELFSPNEQQIRKVYVGDFQPPANIKAQAADLFAGVNTPLVMLQAARGTVPAEVQDGGYDVDSIGRGIGDWVLRNLPNDYQTTGAVDAISTLADSQKRAFMKEFISGGKFYVKTTKGKTYIIFKGARAGRKFITGTRYGLEHEKVTLLTTHAKFISGDVGNVIDGMKNIAEDNRLAMVVVGAIDIVKYFFTPDHKEDLTKLCANLGVDIANIYLAGVGGEATMALIAVTAALLFDVALPAALVAVGGMVLAFGIGYLLNRIEGHVGTENKITEELHGLAKFIEKKA